MRVWRWVVLRCSLEGGMHMHMVLACPTLTPPSHRNPGSAKSAEFSLEFVINNAAEKFIVFSALCFCFSCCLL